MRTCRFLLEGYENTACLRSMFPCTSLSLVPCVGSDLMTGVLSSKQKMREAAIKAEFRSPVNANAFPMIHAPDSVASETLQKVLS